MSKFTCENSTVEILVKIVCFDLISVLKIIIYFDKVYLKLYK